MDGCIVSFRKLTLTLSLSLSFSPLLSPSPPLSFFPLSLSPSPSFPPFPPPPQCRHHFPRNWASSLPRAEQGRGVLFCCSSSAGSDQRPPHTHLLCVIVNSDLGYSQVVAGCMLFLLTCVSSLGAKAVSL